MNQQEYTLKAPAQVSMKSETLPMRFTAILAAALMAGTASADISCEGPKVKVTVQADRAIITLSQKYTYVALCTVGFYSQNLATCVFEDLAGEETIAVLDPNRVLTISSGTAGGERYSFSYEATCTGFENE